jgi:hypothetical protein
LSVNFKFDTGGASLTAGDLPIASGTGPPSLAGTAPIEVGLRDPGALAAFLLEAERISSPATFATFLKRQATLRRETGVDLSSLLGQLTGDLVINSDAHNVIGRVAVGNAAAATAILAKLATAPGGVLAGSAMTREPGGFYAIKDKRRVINVGIASNELVAGEASPGELRAFAAAPAHRRRRDRVARWSSRSQSRRSSSSPSRTPRRSSRRCSPRSATSPDGSPRPQRYDRPGFAGAEVAAVF